MSGKIFVAMSGGVDSSVAALLLKRQGYECVGGKMILFHEKPDTEENREVPSPGKPDDAQVVAEQIGIPFYALDCAGEFERNVVKPFCDLYFSGVTPNPCVTCNRTMKFGYLRRKGEELGCSAMATGHYLRLAKENGRYLIRKGKDHSKDQSYMLYALSQEQLAGLYFPLGELTKVEVRKIAEDAGLVCARKQDSEDICFVPDGDYVSFLYRHTGREPKPGNFVDLYDGHVLGTHLGHVRYTIGQRKGIGLAFPEPRYVCGKNADRNEVFIGKKEALYSESCVLKEFNGIAWDELPGRITCGVKTRYQHEEDRAAVYTDSDGNVRIDFEQPQRALTPGQSAVLYDGETMLGGGIIDKVL